MKQGYRRIVRFGVVGVLGLAVFSVGARAQDPGPAAGAVPAGAQARPRGPRPKPTNLQALSKDLSGDDVIKLMHQYEGDLGVECEYCHARNPETHRNDMPSDANPVKNKARTMIRMTAEINAKYLAELGSDPAPAPVTCGTCHQGHAKPVAFVPAVKAPAAKPPV